MTTESTVTIAAIFRLGQRRIEPARISEQVRDTI